MSAVERELAARFRDETRAKRPVLSLPGERVTLVDPHHVIRKQTLVTHTLTLEPEQAWAIIWDPDNGLPVSRPLHDQLTSAFRRLDVSELRPENIAFARAQRLFHALKREVPSFFEASG